MKKGYGIYNIAGSEFRLSVAVSWAAALTRLYLLLKNFNSDLCRVYDTSVSPPKEPRFPSSSCV